ncbi:unnamed protein product [Pylaiella littoralis]
MVKTIAAPPARGPVAGTAVPPLLLPSAAAAAVVTLVFADGVEVIRSNKNKVKRLLTPRRLTSCLARLLVSYSDALDTHPVVTKSISSGLIGLLGDLLSQTVEYVLGGAAVPWATKRAVWRSCAVMIDGFFINGPLLHYSYEVLEKYMPAGESMRAAAQQVFVDVFVIDPVFAFIFVWSTGLIEARSLTREILPVIENDYPTMVLWLIVVGLCWAPLQVYVFNRYPVQYRVLTADLIDLVWTCIASFHSHV